MALRLLPRLLLSPQTLASHQTQLCQTNRFPVALRRAKRSLLARSLRTALLALGGLALLSSPTTAEDWPQWRGPNRDAKSVEVGLFSKWDADGPPLLGKVEGLGDGYAGVAVVNNTAYTTGNKDGAQVVSAIDTMSGKILWQTPVTGNVPQHDYEGSRSTPSIDGNRLYVVTSSGAIVCLGTKDGSEVWVRDFSDWNGKMMSGWGYSESPLVDGDLVLCTPGGSKGMIVALDKKFGKQIWVSTLPSYGDEQAVGGKGLKDGAGYSSIVISSGGGVKQYIQLVGRGVIGVRASDGKFLWRYERVANGTANIPTPIVTGNYVFTSTAYGTGAALLELSAAGNDSVQVEEVYWLEANQMQNKHGGMVLVDGYVYSGTGNGDGLPICVEFESGEKSWGPVRGEGSGEASMIYADGHLVVRRDDGTVMLLKANPESFDLVNSFMPEFQQGKSWAHPVIANGKLYLREQGTLLVYDAK